MIKYILIALILCSCYTPQKARKQFSRAVVYDPVIGTEYCAEKFPETPPKIIKGDSVVVRDTIQQVGTTRIDTVFVAGKPIEVTKTIILPGQIITNTIVRVDTFERDSPKLQAELALSRINERAAVAGWNAETKDRKEKQAQRNRWRLIAIGLGASWLLFIFFKLRKPKK